MHIRKTCLAAILVIFCNENLLIRAVLFIMISILQRFAENLPSCLCCFLFPVWFCASWFDTQMLLLFSGFSVDLDMCLREWMIFWQLGKKLIVWKIKIQNEQWNILPIIILWNLVSGCRFVLLFLLFFSWQCSLEVLDHTSFFLLVTVFLYCSTHKKNIDMRFCAREKRIEMQTWCLHGLIVTSTPSLSFLSTKRPSLLSVVQFNCTTKGLSCRSSWRSWFKYKT